MTGRKQKEIANEEPDQQTTRKRIQENCGSLGFLEDRVKR